MIKLIIVLIFNIIFSLNLFAQKPLEKVTLQLNWKYQFEFAGFITAKEKGFYEDIGLEVDIKEFKQGINVINEVKNEKATFGLYDASYLNLYDPKKPVVLLANYFKRPALVLVTTQDIVVPSDLKNKKVMFVENELEDTSIGDLLKKHKIKTSDLIPVEHDYTGDKFIRGEVDAFTAFISNELYHITESKVPYRIIDPQNYGITGGGLNLFTSKNFANNHHKKVLDFLEATKKGWEYALSNKAEIVDIIYNNYSKLKSKEALSFEANEIKKLMMSDIYDIGEILENKIADDIKQLQNENRLNTNLSTKDLIFEKKHIFNLDKEEMLYLNRKKRLSYCIDPDWLPFEKLEGAKHIGISKEYINIFQENLNTPIQVFITKDWTETLNSIKSGKCDFLPLAMKTEQRSKYLDFTSAYIKSPLVIATNNQELFIPSVKDIISRKKLGIVKGYAILSVLKQKYPNNKFIEVDSINDGLQKVLEGELYGFVDTLPTIGYEIQNNYYKQLKIAGKFEETFDLSVAVQKEDVHLLSIFNKLVNNIDEDTKYEIFSKWVNVKYEKGVDYSLIWKILAVFVVILLLGLYRQKELLKTNKKIEQQRKDLDQTVSNFKTLLESSMDSIFVTKNEICIDINDNAISLLECKDRKKILNKNIYDVFKIDKYDFYNNLKDETDKKIELQIELPNKKLKPVLIKVSSKDFAGKDVTIFSVIDLTLIKQRELMFLKQSKMASMGEMIGNIAHQWRQPLSVISSVSSGLKLKLLMGKIEINEFGKSLDSLNESAQYLSQTIDDFRNFYKSDKEKHYISVESFVNKNLNLLNSDINTFNIEILKDIKCPNTEMYIYENELMQATVNIFNNAKDALISTNPDKKYIFLQIEEKDDEIVISIKDNGGGIPEDIIQKIFEPYYTTKHKSNGTGIGLYMAHQIIEKHLDGHIHVENVNFSHMGIEYKGAEFKFFIPNF